MTISFPGEGRGPGPASSWTPAFGVPAKYYFAGCPFAGEQEYWIREKA
jgi:hypothetical protein